MLGLMQHQPLLIASILRHAARNHGDTEIVARTTDGGLTRTDWAGVERRARRLANALRALGVAEGDRVATLAWNDHRHVEAYFAVSSMGAVVHTINPRLSDDDLDYVVNHAGDGVLFADPLFAPLLARIAPRVAGVLRHVVVMAAPAHMPELDLPDGIALHCYETLLDGASDAFDWPALDENAASGLCYTSGTTGRPKGVLYSHRSTVLHAMAACTTGAMSPQATDRILPVVPMFHVNGWGTPYVAAMTGCAMVMPGRFLDGASLTALMNEERVTFSAGVPTVWLGLLAHLRATGERLPTVRRLLIGGSACPRMLIDAFRDEYGIRVEHAWGMSETSPLGTYNAPKASNADLAGDAATDLMLKQGRGFFGIEMKIVAPDGGELPWDGVAFGDLKVRGPWVASAYFGQAPGSACDADGWFATGDVATIDADGYMTITDRTKDIVKSGGEWISSIALENIAMSHPDVAEAAVIAARHPKWDERPLLIVVAKADRTLDPAALLAMFEGRIAKWWTPDEVLVVDELPHTATGKVHKLILRQRYADHLVRAAAE